MIWRGYSRLARDGSVIGRKNIDYFFKFANKDNIFAFESRVVAFNKCKWLENIFIRVYIKIYRVRNYYYHLKYLRNMSRRKFYIIKQPPRIIVLYNFCKCKLFSHIQSLIKYFHCLGDIQGSNSYHYTMR